MPLFEDNVPDNLHINADARAARLRLLHNIMTTGEEVLVNEPHVYTVFFPDITLSHWCSMVGVRHQRQEDSSIKGLFHIAFWFDDPTAHLDPDDSIRSISDDDY